MLPLILLSQIALSIADLECDLDKVAIAGGDYRLINGANFGSTVVYTCPKGTYPHPSYTLECLSDGQWSNEKVKAECKAVQCPAPVMYENGKFYPWKEKYFVGDVLRFECWEGFQKYGPENRTCQENGKWSGEETKCDNLEDDCPNPGVPIGALKVGLSYKIKDKVTYECQPGLQMFGSDTRVCMENNRWSGAEPSCRYWYAFDTPQEVAKTFSASLSETIESSDLDKKEDQDRRIIVKINGMMNIFILIDASKGVGEENFITAKEAIEVFIEKMSSYDFVPRYAIILFAASAKSIVLLSDDESTDPDAVIERIKQFKYSEHGDKQGRNTRGALREVHEMLSLENVRDPEKFRKMKNVILLMTHGDHNVGGDPIVELKRIREILDIRLNNNREDFLDVYVFGLGNEINDIASKKDLEKHVFKLESAHALKETFNAMIDEAEGPPMCGLSKEPYQDEAGKEEMYPWIAKIVITRAGSEEKCKGSIVSKYFILTAAHCFHLDESLHAINIDIGGKTYKAKNLYRHSKYNPLGKQDKKVEKSFDYDLALIRLDKEILFSSTVRPICLPCTTGASWALKQRGTSVTCSDHEKTLFSSELVKAMFIAEESHKDLQRKDVIIKRGTKRLACLNDVKKIEQFKYISDIKDLVTDNFLCTGGIEPQVDPQTCKGDFGGPLIVRFQQRYIQVGIISWKTINSCYGSRRPKRPVPVLSRDFHTDLFHMLDWLKEKLEFDLEFLN